MPSLFWLALLLGYLTGVTAAVLLLPSRLIEPLYGPLALTTVIVVAAFGVLLRLRRVRRGADYGSASPPREPPPGAGRLHSPADEPDAPQADDEQPDERDRSTDERWPLMVRLEPPGVIGPSELRQILYEGRVDVRLRPLASLAPPHAALYYALPRLRGVGDEQLEPARYLTTAARAGLLGTIDRLLLLRCAGMLRRTRADGHQATVICGIAAPSLDDPGFMAELEQQLSDEPRLAESLVLALDHVVQDQPGIRVLTSLRARGVRFCLRRLGPPPLGPDELRVAGFTFVLLEAGRFTRSAPEGEIDPALRALQDAFGESGPRLLITRAGAGSVTIPGDWALSAQDGAFELARPSAA